MTARWRPLAIKTEKIAMSDHQLIIETVEELDMLIGRAWTVERAHRPEIKARIRALLLKLMKQLGKNEGELAKALGFGRQTVIRWLRGGVMPRPNVGIRLRSLVEEPSPGFVQAPKREPCPFSAADIVERERLAKEVWVFKWVRPFVTSDEPDFIAFTQEMLQAIEGKKVMDVPVIHYIFPASDLLEELQGVSEPSRAEQSFADLTKELLEQCAAEHAGDIQRHWRGHRITKLKDLIVFGLPSIDIGYVLVLYGQRGRLKYNRLFSLFLEFQGQLGPAWVELPVSVARQVRDGWSSVLASQRDLKTVVQLNAA